MVDVQERTLCTFGEHVLTFCQSLVDFVFCVGEGETTHIVDAFEPRLFLFGEVEIGESEVAQDLEVTRFEASYWEEISLDVSHTETHARSLVAVGRTNALTGGAHLALTFCRFIGTVEHAVRGENQMRTATDVQTLHDFITR